MDSRGNFYAGTRGRGGQLLTWSPDGTLQRTIGVPGEGPGELAPGAVIPMIGQPRWYATSPSPEDFLGHRVFSLALRNSRGGSFSMSAE